MAQILVIEDDTVNATLTTYNLQKEGHEVLQAENGQLGVKIAEEMIPDLIICDISMPVMDGYMTLQYIRSHPQTAMIPFILLTARDDRPSWRKGISLGADDFLTKPYNSEDLIDAVNQQFKRKSTIEENRDEAIRLSLDQEREIFVAGPVSVVKLNPENNYSIEFISENIHQWGFRSSELMNPQQSFLNIIPLEDQEQVKIIFNKARQQQSRHFEIEHRIQLPDNTYSWVHGYFKPHHGISDNQSYLHGYIIDITARKSMEQELLELRQREKGKLNKLLDSYKLPNETQDFPSSFKTIDTCSGNYIKVLHEADLHATSDIPVLITGESGTGKDQLAKAIHRSSPAAKKPFYHISMASFNETMQTIEKDYQKILQQDESTHKQSDNWSGTIFIDEIGHLPLDYQGRLLRILQDTDLNNTYYFNTLKKPTSRIIAATSMDPEQLIQKGILRKDLYYRLRGAWLHIPALRERKDDIPLLLKTFFHEIGGSYHDNSIESKTWKILMSYPFPGNIRELRSAVLHAINLSRGETITLKHLPASIKNFHQKQTPKENGVTDIELISMYDVEKEHILKAYHAMGSNKMKTARALDISLSTLRRKLEQYEEDDS